MKSFKKLKEFSKSIKIGGRELTLKTGHLAGHADSAVLARYGDTMVLVTVCQSSPRADLDYFPLSVDYVERLYAGGRISSSRFIKRERMPSEEAILNGRLVDRSIRPLFPKDFFNEVQVVITVLSVDSENDPGVLAIIATSAALAISDIPWNGPIGAVRLGLKENSFFINPVNGELELSEMDLVVSGTSEAIVMVEAKASEVNEDSMTKALKKAKDEIKPVIDLIEDLRKEVGVEKATMVQKEDEEEVISELRKTIQNDYLPQLQDPEVALDETWGDHSLKELEEKFAEKEIEKKVLAKIFFEEFKSYVRQEILKKGHRLDGRKPDEIRELEIEVGVLPRAHGSAIFRRGQTQVLSAVTLGSPTLEQLIEGMEGEERKRYMHHYNFPPFSTGEVRRLGAPGRREIGHGNLAERALVPVIPTEEKFPYAIRVVSEVLSSSGSTSMASVCGSTLSLMDAGVPIKEPVAGIAMGLMTDGEKHVVLTDIAYTEDANGDMDFKVAGTKNGITALQMDIKISGVKNVILVEALEKARQARLFILEKMLNIIPTYRSEVSSYAPKIAVLHIPTEMIGEVIGPGGKIIRKIIAETQAVVDVEDDGKVTISGMKAENIEKAVQWVQGLTREVKPEETFEGEVKRILPFGAFVEILPGKEGLVRVSQMSTSFVSEPSEVVQIGQKVKVRVIEIDDQGRINLSMLFGEDAKKVVRDSRPERKFSSAPGHHRRPGGGFQDRFRKRSRF
ncbi:polyribonucleotide nucleotidyltransferase [Candidatus Microgenomates bacterium]|nr:polyribonucleotide nucleotidyltransferase [Candidatus Microgenomates bacterium]